MMESKVICNTTVMQKNFKIHILWTSQIKLLLSYPSLMPAVKLKQWKAAVDMRTN